MGYEWAKDLVHVPFGLVSLGDGKLSTRQGHVVLMEDILNQSVEKTRGIIESKNPNLEIRKQLLKKLVSVQLFLMIYITQELRMLYLI